MATKEVIHTGFHSNIYWEVTDESKSLIHKHHTFHNQGETREVLVELMGHMDRYDQIAGQLNIPLPINQGRFIIPNGIPDRYMIYDISHQVGPDARVLLEDPRVNDHLALGILEDYLDLHARVWAADQPISLDPPLANFCLNAAGELAYIDPMPPRQKLPNGECLCEWPAPPDQNVDFIAQRYLTPLQARVIYAQMIRCVDGRSAISPNQLKDLIGKHLGDQAYDLVQINESEKLRVLLDPQPIDVDVIRIIAAEAAYEGYLSKSEKDREGTLFLNGQSIIASC